VDEVFPEAEGIRVVLDNLNTHTPAVLYQVSIPSRGFWFFEGSVTDLIEVLCWAQQFQSPRGDFGFLKSRLLR